MFPSSARLDRLLAPHADVSGLVVRVWGVDAGSTPSRPPSLEAECYAGPPRLVLLGAAPDGLVVVRQRPGAAEAYDGARIPWTHVVRLERDPHLVRDLIRVEARGQAPLFVGVANHVFLPANRSAAKSLCDLRRGGDRLLAMRVEDIIPTYGAHDGPAPEARPA